MTATTEDVSTYLTARFGPLNMSAVKPFSVSHRTADNQTIIKIYRVIDPVGRQQREVEALTVAPTLGLAVPTVLDHGRIDDLAWAAFAVVPGTPGDLAERGASFLAQARDVMAALHRHECHGVPGPGWSSGEAAPGATSTHLTAQLSARAATMPWWPTLADHLRQLDEQPLVRLHGDLKPEHLIVGPEDIYVVDWEACARGPAACEYADVIFHLARDLVYAGDRPRLPLDILAEFPPGLPVALAWRLVQWADRRRPDDLALLPATLLLQLTQERDEARAATLVAAIVTRMRALGTPR
jgi:hypothetical protein